MCLSATLSAAPVRLRCEYLTDPIGIDIARPSLSWQNDSTARNWQQKAYQLLVATDAGLLKSGKADVWDSGQRASGESVAIPYNGPTLQPRRRYYWAVRVWDIKGHREQSSEAAWWEMGLLQKQDWKAKWVRWQDPEQAEDMSGIRWIWVAGQDAQHVHMHSDAYFHLDLDLPALPYRAALDLIARGDWKVTVNGKDAGQKPHWNEFDRRDLDGFLHAGQNSIDVTVKAPGPPDFGPGAGKGDAFPAALAALLKVRRADGTLMRIPSGTQWQARLHPEDPWAPAAVVGALGDAAFGGDPGALPQPAALLRHDFTAPKAVARARAYVTALGAYQLFINGERVSKDVLTPGFTQYDKRVQYQTYDVTALLSKGPNAVAAVLGNGWFGSGLAWTAEHFKVLPPVRLLAQIEIEYADGSHDTVLSDETWKTAPSPIIRDEIYAGESYDARLQKPGWDKAGFNDSEWSPAQIAGPYQGEISAQIDVPPQVVANIKPEHIDARPDGSYILDIGQNMVGWVALKVNGQAGTTVRLRFAEILNPDGSIYTDQPA